MSLPKIPRIIAANIMTTTAVNSRTNVGPRPTKHSDIYICGPIRGFLRFFDDGTKFFLVYFICDILTSLVPFFSLSSALFDFVIVLCPKRFESVWKVLFLDIEEISLTCVRERVSSARSAVPGDGESVADPAAAATRPPRHLGG